MGLISILVLGVVLIYFYIDPSSSYLMPKCPFKMLTGLDCPSCGSQRAFHAVLHGQFEAAFLLNPYIFLVFPYLLLLLYTYLSDSTLAQRISPVIQHRMMLYGYILLYLAWWILRNTPLWN